MALTGFMHVLEESALGGGSECVENRVCCSHKVWKPMLLMVV